jgi:putative transposase
MDPKTPTRKAYPSDLSDERWELIKDLVPEPPEGGPQEHLLNGRNVYSRREVVNAMLYITRAGCPWRYLPHDFPPWELVYHYFQEFTRKGVWDKIGEALRRRTRRNEGREPTATAGSLDSQTVAGTATSGVHGYDGGKKIRGRKRHVLVDTLGLLIALHVTSGNVQDRDAALPVLEKAAEMEPTLEKVWADGAYQGPRVQAASRRTGIAVEITHGGKKGEGFRLATNRWVVERSFGWLGWDRRLNRDYEKTTMSAEAFVKIGFIGIMLKRTPENNPSA